MNRATIEQVACSTIVALFGMLLILLGASSSEPRETPHPTMTLRPATEQERRQSERDRLREEMDRIWEQHRH